MSEPRSGEENPYASPSSDTQHGKRGPNDPDVIIIDPWLPPRNVIDLLAGLAAIMPAWALLIVVTGIIGFIEFGRLGMLAGAGLGVLVVLPIWLTLTVVLPRSNCVLPFLGITHLSVHAVGIDFHRFLAKPKSICWERLLSVRPARPRDVFILSWVLMPFGRELTATRSIHGHYKIEWGERYSFFPPRDPSLFCDAIQRFQPRLLVEDES